MDSLLKNVLTHDPIDAYEKEHGETIYGTPDMGMLTDFAAFNEAKRRVLESCGDTHLGVTWQQYLKIAVGMGFDVVLEDTIQSYDIWDRNQRNIRNEKLVVLYHEDLHLVLVLESYRAKSVNSAKLFWSCKPREYAQVTLKDGSVALELPQSYHNVGLRASSGWYLPDGSQPREYGLSREMVNTMSMDAREGLVYAVGQIAQNAITQDAPPGTHWLSYVLANYFEVDISEKLREESKDPYNYDNTYAEACTKSRIARLPQKIRKCLGC